MAEEPQSKALRARTGAPVQTAENCVFSYRLEIGSSECFVGVRAISNNFQYRLEIRSEAVREAGWGASGGNVGVPLRMSMKMELFS